ncbi:OFA family MFS transporter [Thermosynechococcaceae cyanobacterium Okahandja]
MSVESFTVTLFGLRAQRGRWLLIPIGMVLLLCLGTVYSWSVFRTPLAHELQLNATSSLLPYATALVFYATLMPITGYYLRRWGSRAVTVIGGILVTAGYLGASVANSALALTLSYGVVVGTGVGMVYGVPMAVVAAWFPDRKGLAVGATIVGFGLSPLITAPLANRLIEALSVRTTLQILGVAFGLIIATGALWMRFPPAAWQGVVAPRHGTVAPVSYPPRLLRSRSFYGLWSCYALGSFIGLSSIGISGAVAQEVIGLTPTAAAASVSLFAVFNGLSRPLMGWLGDRCRPSHVAMAIFTCTLVAALLMTHAQSGDQWPFRIAFSLLWFCLGGWLAMAPTFTLRFFNPADYAKNYGLVFTAYGVGALLGTLVSGQLRDRLGSYTAVFYLMASLGVMGILLAATLLKPDRSASGANRDQP